MSSFTLPQGARAPFSIGIAAVPDLSGKTTPIDMTTIISVTWTVTRPDKTVVVWAPTIAPGATPNVALVNYTLAADGSDLAQVNLYLVEVENTVPGGTVPGTQFSFFVVPANQWHGP